MNSTYMSPMASELQTIIDNSDTHTCTVYLTKTSNTSDPNLYIQINRNATHVSGTTVRISEIKLELFNETVSQNFYGGFPRLTFQRDRIIEFDQNTDQKDIIPKNWNQTSIQINKVYTYEAYSPLGWWGLRASSQGSTSYLPTYVVDGSGKNDYWKPAVLSKGEWGYWWISCPQPICPLQIIVQYKYMGSTSNNAKIMGFNVDTHRWEQIATLTRSSSIKEDTIDLTSTSSFYSAFRIDVTKYNSSNTYNYLYKFAISKGKILLTPGLDGGQGGYQTFTNM